MLSPETQLKLEAQLLAAKLVSQQGLDEAKQTAAKKGITLGEALLQLRLVDEEPLTREMAKVAGVQYANLQSFTVPATVLGKLPRDTADKYQAVPFGYLGERLAIAMLDPTNIPAVDFLTRKVGQPIVAFQVSNT